MSDNMNPTRIGQANLAGDDRALYLTMYAGEVLKAFRTKTVAMGRHLIRTITSGKTAQFPASWKGGAEYHVPGTRISGSLVAVNERTISIDDLLIAPRSLANIDEAMSHFEMRGELAVDAGDALAQRFDQNVLRVMVLAARASATVTGGNGGTRVIDATNDTDISVFVASVGAAVQALAEKDVPLDDLVLFVTPAKYYDLIDHPKLTNRDYTDGNGGGLATGKVLRIYGVPVFMTNNMPRTNVTTGPAAYRGDFTVTEGILTHKSAVGTVKLIDLAVESDYLIEYQSWLLVAKYAVGHGILRPECAVEICTA